MMLWQSVALWAGCRGGCVLCRGGGVCGHGAATGAHWLCEAMNRQPWLLGQQATSHPVHFIPIWHASEALDLIRQIRLLAPVKDAQPRKRAQSLFGSMALALPAGTDLAALLHKSPGTINRDAR